MMLVFNQYMLVYGQPFSFQFLILYQMKTMIYLSLPDDRLRLQGLGDPNPNDVSDFVEVCAGLYMGIGICKLGGSLVQTQPTKLWEFNHDHLSSTAY